MRPKNVILESYKSLTENRNKLAAAEAARINEAAQDRESFKDNYYSIRENRVKAEAAHAALLESERNKALSKVMKAIYITALEAETLTDTGLRLAENMVDSYIKENGGASRILNNKNANKTYFLSRITQIVEDAAQEETEKIESGEKEAKDDEVANMDNALAAAKDFMATASKEELKDFVDQIKDESDERKEDIKSEEKAAKSEEKETAEAEKTVEKAKEPKIDEEAAKESEDDDEKSEESTDKDSDDQDDEKEDNSKDKDDSDDEEKSEEEPEEDEDSESTEPDDADKTDDDNVGEDEEDDADTTEAEDIDTDDPMNDVDEENEEEDDDADESGADNSGDSADQGDDVDETEGSDSSDNSSSDSDEAGSEDVDTDFDDEDDDEEVESEPKLTGDKVFDELDKEEDVQKAVDLIRSRVADAEKTFIKNNAEDKKKIDELLNKISSNVKTVEDLNDKNAAESKIAEESVRMIKRKIDAIRENRTHTVFEDVARRFSSNIVKDSVVKEHYIEESGQLDMDLLMESVKVVYTFMETVNTLQLENTSCDSIKTMLNEMAG